MARRSPAIPAARSAVDYAREIRPGGWQYTSGPSKGRFAPTRRGLPFLPGWKKDSAGRAYNLAERRARAARTILKPAPRGKIPPSKASYSRRFGMSRLGGLPSVYALDSAQKEIKALSAEFPPDYWGSLVAGAKRTFKRGPLLGASTNGPHFRIVGQAGKATHWRTFIARWKVEKGWSIDASGITTPDVRLAIDSMSSLSLQYGDDAGGAGGVPDREARQYADHWDRGALPEPTITVAIPVKRITRERWTRETAAKK